MFPYTRQITRKLLLNGKTTGRLILKRMCVTYFCQSEISQPGGYWLILANNRDELWDRPTKDAHFWGPNDSCFCARDQTEGREGGTWLGVNTKGKVAVLVNILGQFDPDKLGRGSLVSNYISSDVDMGDYAEGLKGSLDSYNGFNLVLFDLGKKEESVVCKPLLVSNASIYPDVVRQRHLPSNKFLGLSNSTMEYPFQKVEKGKELFGQIVMQYPAVSQKDHLIDNLFEMMGDRTSLLPDPVLERAGASTGKPPSILAQYSAINVHCPQIRYGSRTSTVLLIDSEGHVDFVEKTMDFTADADNPPTVLSHKSFDLSPSDMNHNQLDSTKVSKT